MKFAEELNSIAKGSQPTTESLKTMLSREGYREASSIWKEIKKALIEAAECGYFGLGFEKGIDVDTKLEMQTIARYLGKLMQDEGLDVKSEKLDLTTNVLSFDVDWMDKI